MDKDALRVAVGRGSSAKLGHLRAVTQDGKVWEHKKKSSHACALQQNCWANWLRCKNPDVRWGGARETWHQLSARTVPRSVKYNVVTCPMRYKVSLKAHHLQSDSERELTDSCSFPLGRRNGVFWFSRLRWRFFWSPGRFYSSFPFLVSQLLWPQVFRKRDIRSRRLVPVVSRGTVETTIPPVSQPFRVIHWQVRNCDIVHPLRRKSLPPLRRKSPPPLLRSIDISAAQGSILLFLVPPDIRTRKRLLRSSLVLFLSHKPKNHDLPNKHINAWASTLTLAGISSPYVPAKSRVYPRQWGQIVLSCLPFHCWKWFSQTIAHALVGVLL